MRDDADSRLSIRDAITVFMMLVAAMAIVATYVGAYNRSLCQTEGSVRALTKQVEDLQTEIQQARCRP